MQKKSTFESAFASPRALIVLLLCAAAAYWMVSGTVLAVFGPQGPAKVSNRTLTFADRVSYQRAIEEVYWRHRIWPKANPGPKPSLEAVISQAQLEQKVEEYLRNSTALEDYWQRPITAEQLRAEMDRMARDSKQPGVLRELFEALGNDPFVIAECLARPLLAERLLTHSASELVKQTSQTYEHVVAATGDYSLPSVSDEGGCSDDTWAATSTVNAPAGRFLHTAVWTGSEMIVWGGRDGSNELNTGGRYNPTTDSWTATSTTNAPAGRDLHTAVWTGTEMIIWGGADGPNSGDNVNTGGRYNPGTNSWSATSTSNAPTAREYHTAVWTGSEMIVWGGANDFYGFFNTGGRYNPRTNSWTAASTTNAPTARYGHTAVWTGSEMIVWGGIDGLDNFLNTGGRYNPGTNSWTATSTTNAASGRYYHTAVWTGSEMIVWGGDVPSDPPHLNAGGRYNPSTDSWIATSTTNAPSDRRGHTAVWTGNEMIVWGGVNLNTGARYNPGANSWTAISTTSAPSGRTYHTAVWTGSEMIVWGGGGSNYLRTGGRYCAEFTVRYDFNGDGHSDCVLYNPSTHRTAIWYLNNSVYLSARYGPTLPLGWVLVDVADFLGDSHPDYVLRNPITRQTAIWYLNNNVYVSAVYGPTPPSGWQLVATADFNGDGHLDYVLYNAATRRTAIWYLNNNVYVDSTYGPTLRVGWSLIGLADFNRDGKTDYLLFNSTTRQSAIWYLNNNVYFGAGYGPTLPSGWQLKGTADFNGDSKPDYVLYKAITHQTAIWYLNNNVYEVATFGPTVPPGWSLIAP